MTKDKKGLVFCIAFSIIMVIQLAMIVLKGMEIIRFNWLLVFTPVWFSCLASLLFLVLFIIYDSIFLFGYDDD